MKKLLGIVVLGLLLGCAGGNKGSIYDYMNVGMTKEEWRYWTSAGKFFTPTFKYYKSIELHPAKWHDFSFGLCGNEHTKKRARSKGVLHLKMFWDEGYKYFPKYKTEVISHVYDPQSWTIADAHRIKRPWYVFDNVTRPINCRPGGKPGEYGDEKSNGILKAIVWSEDEALRIADPVYAKKVEEREKKEEKRLAEEKKAAEEKRLAEEKKRKEEELKKLASKHGDKCEKKSSNQEGFEKDTPEFNNCLIVKEKERVRIEKEEAKRLKLEEEKLKNMKPQQRAEYKCINTFGFKKGTDNYNECLFKLYSVELELEKMKLEHEIQVQRLALEREKVKAAKAQTEAAKAQAEAAYRSALANEEQAYQQRRSNAQKSINQGMRMLSGACTLGVNC